MSLRYLDALIPPMEDPIAGKMGTVSPRWFDWFGRLQGSLDTIPNVINSVVLSDQGAAISATDFSGSSLRAGIYRVSYHARITQAATTNSSLTVTIAWTEGTVAQSISGSAITGNTTTTLQNSSFLIRVDAASTVTYATAYSSTGATSMQYSLDLSIEKIRGTL